MISRREKRKINSKLTVGEKTQWVPLANKLKKIHRENTKITK